MKDQKKLNIGDCDTTESGNGKTNKLNDEIADLLNNYIINTEQSKEKYTSEAYLDTFIAEHTELRKFVSDSDRSSCAINLTNSTKLDDNLELMGFFQWIEKICFLIGLKINIELPNFDNNQNFKQDFANRSTSIGIDNIDKILKFILIEYHQKFDDKGYRNISDSLHQYQFLKIMNRSLQKTQMAKHSLPLDMFMLTENELIHSVSKLHGKIPLTVSSEEDISTTVDGIVNYIKAADEYNNNLN